MGFNFSFFGNQEHRVFNYKPRYFDPEKEERKRIFGKVDGSLEDVKPDSVKPDSAKPDNAKPGQGDPKEEYTPGKYISGSFRDGNYQRTKPDTGRTHKLIGLVGLLLFFVILYYIVQFYGYILK